MKILDDVKTKTWFSIGTWMLLLFIITFFIQSDFYGISCFRLIFGVGTFATFGIYVLKSCQKEEKPYTKG